MTSQQATKVGKVRSTFASSMTSAIVGTAVFLGSLMLFGYSAFMDPDPHHDGVQIVPAVAIAQGLTVHAGVFDQYGPITAWVHALAVEAFGPRLLTIRFVTAALLAMCATLMFLVARRVIRWSWIPLSLTIAWVLTWPGRSVDDVTYLFLPWPSITFLWLQLLVALPLIGVVAGRHRSLQKVAVIGALVSTAVLTRLNYGIPLAVVVALTLWLMVDWGPREGRRAAAAFAAGLALPALAVFAYLAWQGAVQSFIQDAILGPLAGGATDGSTPWFFYKNVVILGSIPVLVTLGTLLFVSRVRPASRSWPWLLGGFGTAGLTLWASTSIEGSPLRDAILSRLTWAPALDQQGFQPLYAMAVLIPVVAVLVVRSAWLESLRGQSTPADTESGARIRRLRRAPSIARIEMSLLLLALASMVQCYPFIDPNHLWWAAPLPMILVMHVVTRFITVKWAAAVTTVLLVPPILIAIPRLMDYVAKPREVVSGGVLDGMLAPTERIDDIRATQEALAGLMPGINRFDCWNGIFAVWNGTYLADTSAFVNWAPGFEVSEGLQPDGVIVRCLQVTESGGPENLPMPAGYRVRSIQGPISISYYNLMYLQVLEPQTSS